MMILAACGGDGATPPDDNLSADQVQSMATALRSLLALSLLTPDASVASSARFKARSLMADAEPISRSHACPEGGHVAVGGSFAPDDNGHIVFALSDTLVDCGIRDDKSNVWTFTTKPSLESSIVEGFDGDSTDVPIFTARETDVGRVEYSTGSISGTCSMDVAIESKFLFHSPTADSNTVTLHTTGSLCGRSLQSDTSITTLAPSPP